VRKDRTGSIHEASGKSGGSVEGVLPSGDRAAQSGIAAAALGMGTSKYGAVATLQKLVNFAQSHRKREQFRVWIVANPGIEVN